MRSTHRHLDTDQPLKGLKLVVCGYELEQREHRGIAVFSKGLLRSLKQAGAEVWLLSEVAPQNAPLSPHTFSPTWPRYDLEPGKTPNRDPATSSEMLQTKAQIRARPREPIG